MAKTVFWVWLLVLFLLNVIPLGNDASKALTGKRFIFRLDYLFHFFMMLIFAIIWVVGKNRNVNWFAKHETLIYCAVVVLAGIALELLQLALPWRAFNRMDMFSNLIGAGLTVLIILILNYHYLKKFKRINPS